MLEFKDLKTDSSSFYGYKGTLYVCDKDSKLYGGFYLMRPVKQSDLQGKMSGASTPSGEVGCFTNRVEYRPLELRNVNFRVMEVVSRRKSAAFPCD